MLSPNSKQASQDAISTFLLLFRLLLILVLTVFTLLLLSFKVISLSESQVRICNQEKFSLSLISSIKVIGPKSTFFIFQITCNNITYLQSQSLSSGTRRTTLLMLHGHEGPQCQTFNFTFRLYYLKVTGRKKNTTGVKESIKLYYMKCSL